MNDPAIAGSCQIVEEKIVDDDTRLILNRERELQSIIGDLFAAEGAHGRMYDSINLVAPALHPSGSVFGALDSRQVSLNKCSAGCTILLESLCSSFASCLIAPDNCQVRTFASDLLSGSLTDTSCSPKEHKMLRYQSARSHVVDRSRMVGADGIWKIGSLSKT